MAWLDGGGEMGALVRSLDWSQTPLGPIDSWPASLQTTVGTLLHSRHPMFLWWGPELIQIYNDAYVPSFGKGKHPAAMGQRGAECWQEIWPLIFPQIDDVMRRGKASWNEDQLVPIWRNGRIEEVYWTYGYSPVFRETGEVGGTLVVCTETTARVVAERRLGVLRQLSTRLGGETTVAGARATASELLAPNPNDTPWALIYSLDAATGAPVLEASPGLDEAASKRVDEALRPKLIGGAWSGSFELGFPVEAGPWPEPVTRAFVAPLTAGPQAHRVGYLVFGLSARLPFDADYRSFAVQFAENLALSLTQIEIRLAKDATAVERDNLLLQAPVGTAIFRGPEHVFELANALYCRMVGRTDLVGKTYRQAFPELITSGLPEVLDRVYQTGQPFASGEFLLKLDKSGKGTLEDCYFTFNLEALRDERRQVYGMMAVGTEITDQVNARKAVERTQQERELLLRELERANRAKDEFLAMLGHELRNPLSPIVTALELMRRREPGHAPKEQEIIRRQVEHLVHLVDDLLDVSKITRGKIALRREPVEMARVVSRAVEIASDVLEQRRHRLEIEVPAEGLQVDGDSVRLAQVVANLLTNAARYTNRGGQVTVRAEATGADVRLVVKDTGVGIPAEMLPHLFEIFFQGQRSHDRKEGGLGLGLALVKNLVTLHGGTVAAHSDGLGTGSEFEIRLPRLIGPAKPVVLAPTNARLEAQPARRVLIVDDNADAAEMLGEILESAGHQVAIAHDGLAGLKLAEEFRPEIALLDIGLPVIDGYELGRRLHRTSTAARCRLIALTGYGQAHDRERSREAGFEAHLVKPVELKLLLDLVAAPA